MRLAYLAALALCLTGCAGTKLNVGYDFTAKRFCAQLEAPLEQGLKK